LTGTSNGRQGNDFQTHEYIPEVKNLLMRSYQSTDMLGLLFCHEIVFTQRIGRERNMGKEENVRGGGKRLGQIAGPMEMNA